MDLFEAIARRHSYRGPYKSIPVSGEDLKKIIQAGIGAPSGKNAQTTSFIIIDDKEIIREISSMPGANTAVQQARAFIACIVDREPNLIYHGFSFQLEDCAAAVENMLLAITALGYASVWIDGWLRVEERGQKISELLELPADKKIQVLLPIGVPVEIREQKEKKPFEQRVSFNRWINRGVREE